MKTLRAAGLATILAFAACGAEQPEPAARRGDAARRREAFARYGCGSCHHVPGIPGARGVVGPSLRGLAARPYLAGRLPNDPANLEAWIRRPRALDPGTLMPDLAVSEQDARNIAAFLSGQSPPKR